MTSFKIGDVVRLKSGSPSMVVVSVPQANAFDPQDSPPNPEDVMIELQWYCQEKEDFKKTKLQESALKIDDSDGDSIKDPIKDLFERIEELEKMMGI